MTVIKCGGSSLPKLNKEFAHFVKEWQKLENVVLVHGGGPAIADLERKLNLRSEFDSRGRRITNRETLDVVVQCLCGSVNSQLVSLLAASGVTAFGLSGFDGGLLQAKLKNYEELGWVGQIVAVKSEILQMLCRQGFLPVVAPVSLHIKNHAKDMEGQAWVAPGQLLNVNADDAASAIANALQARSMVFVSDVPGIMDSNKNILAEVNAAQIEEMIASDVICGGMIPKVEGALSVLRDKNNSLEEIFIIDGTSDTLSREGQTARTNGRTENPPNFGDRGIGTRIRL
ncbi:acetylglutamate kinase [Candidatus Haliotispira prima]|uniref:Acetylglutamate kinase n=1 Tax=Candidatus Haliotispira prima TaxID=3034016 RepID=A0ABY8MFJ8_9SPIO|nr:acetylglutamate kinase [Candidatus Haliotispira prima]